MKRNRFFKRAMHEAGREAPSEDGEGKSKYAKKVRAGNQMYGPGCCAHKLKLRHVDITPGGLSSVPTIRGTK